MANSGTLRLAAGATIPTPDAGKLIVAPKDDGALYIKNSSSVESKVVVCPAAYTAYGYVPVAAGLSELAGKLVGEAVNTGTYSIGPQGSGANYAYNYPSASRALNFRMIAKWTAANVGYTAEVQPSGGMSGIYTRSNAANGYWDATGIVTLESNGWCRLIISNSNTAAFYLWVLGYFI